MSTRGSNGSRQSTSPALPNAQWFLRLALLFFALAPLTAVLMIFRENGFYLFSIDSIAISIFMIIFSLFGPFIDRMLIRFSINLFAEMLETGLIEVSLREAPE